MYSQKQFQGANSSNPKPGIDYSEVAAVTGLDYQKAIYTTAAFLAINVFFLDWPMTMLGMIATTVLAVRSWNYFRAYFEKTDDAYSNYAVLGMIGMHVIFAIIYLILYVTDWAEMLYGTSAEVIICMISGDCSGDSYTQDFTILLFLIQIAVYGPLLVYIVGGIRLLRIRKSLPFPVKRIAIPAMLLTPVLFLHYLLIGLWGDPDSSLFGRIVLIVPYFMLLHHFYQVKKAADFMRPVPPDPSEVKNYNEEDFI
jgi:hypothetical protein